MACMLMCEIVAVMVRDLSMVVCADFGVCEMED